MSNQQTPSTENAPILNGYDPYWFCDYFTPDDISLLKTTFHEKLMQSVESIGVAAFTMLFEEYPEVFQIFANDRVLPTNREDVSYSWEVKAQSLLVLSSIEKCLNRLDNRSAFIEFVRNLSARHQSYGIVPHYFSSMMGCVRKAMFDHLGTEMFPPSEPNSRRSSVNIKTIQAGAASISRENSHTAESKNQPNTVNSFELFNKTPEYAVWNRFFMALTLSLTHFSEITIDKPAPTSSDSAQSDSNNNNNNNNSPPSPQEASRPNAKHTSSESAFNESFRRRAGTGTSNNSGSGKEK